MGQGDTSDKRNKTSCTTLSLLFSTSSKVNMDMDYLVLRDSPTIDKTKTEKGKTKQEQPVTTPLDTPDEPETQITPTS